MTDLLLVWIAFGAVAAAHALADWWRARRHESAAHLDERTLVDVGLRHKRGARLDKLNANG